MIEDDKEIATLLERYLRRLGYLVVHAVDGQAGIDTFAGGGFDLVLTDGLLPKKNGFDTVSAIRAMPNSRGVGVVMMSAAFKNARARNDATARGVDAFFAKPFVLAELRDKLAELLVRQGKPVPVSDLAEGSDGTAPTPPSSPPQPVRAAAPPASPPASPAASPEAVRTEPRPAPRAGASEAIPEQSSVQQPTDVAALLLRCARSKFNGTLHFSQAQDTLTVAFLSGAIVGAVDNLRDQWIGERLWRSGRLDAQQMHTLSQRMAERGERAAEALLALGWCRADEAFSLVEEQIAARAHRALTWTGDVKATLGEAPALALAGTALDTLDVVLGWAIAAESAPAAAAFVNATDGLPLVKHPRFEEMLMSFARISPAARLPGAVLSGIAATIGDAVRASSASEVYAAWIGGLIAPGPDATFDTRPLPTLLKSQMSVLQGDRAAIELVCQTLLHIRGRPAYTWLGVAPSSAPEVVLQQLDVLVGTVGPNALAGKVLGPAAAAARELWQCLDEVGIVFADPSLRANYDEMYASAQPTPPPPAAEDAFLQGQVALAAGDVTRARAWFGAAVQANEHDANYQAYLAWAEITTGDRSIGTQRLHATLHLHPQSVRPLYFLGLLALNDGDHARARELLTECVRRSPGDRDLLNALHTLASM
jgi:CheY-like chemotaxis protein